VSSEKKKPFDVKERFRKSLDKARTKANELPPGVLQNAGMALGQTLVAAVTGKTLDPFDAFLVPVYGEGTRAAVEWVRERPGRRRVVLESDEFGAVTFWAEQDGKRERFNILRGGASDDDEKR
jgi:hypothetical protein